jgi:hypothetical protein
MKETRFVLLFLASGIFVSCDKEKSFAPLNENGYMKMQINGSSKKDTANATLNRVDNTITITSTLVSSSSIPYDRIIINLSGSTVGSYFSNS